MRSWVRRQAIYSNAMLSNLDAILEEASVRANDLTVQNHLPRQLVLLPMFLLCGIGWHTRFLPNLMATVLVR